MHYSRIYNYFQNFCCFKTVSIYKTVIEEESDLQIILLMKAPIDIEDILSFPIIYNMPTKNNKKVDSLDQESTFGLHRFIRMSIIVVQRIFDAY